MIWKFLFNVFFLCFKMFACFLVTISILIMIFQIIVIFFTYIQMCDFSKHFFILSNSVVTFLSSGFKSGQRHGRAREA